MLFMTLILLISLPKANEETELRPCGWEANDEEGVADKETR